MAEMRVVVLEGSPTEMGLRHGRLLGGEIRFLLQQMDRHIFRRVGILRAPGLRVIAHGFGLAMNRHIPPHLREEMRGIAAGSGARYLEILLLNTLDDVLNILRRLAPRTPHLACSSFALFGGRCRDGSLMHGRNLDYHFRGTPLDDGGAVSRLLQSRALLFACHPHGRAAFVSVGWPGLVGAVTAMNREGISLGNLTSYLRGATPDGLPAALLYRTVLEEASTLRKAGDRLRAARRTMGNNLLVGSGKENGAALFEITPRVVLEVAPQEGMLVAANHFLSPGLARRQRPHLIPHSVARWERLCQLCDRQGISVEEALDFLGDVGCAGPQWGGNPFARVANEGTAVSVLFRPAEMEMWLGLSAEPPASRGEFRRLDAAEVMARPAKVTM